MSEVSLREFIERIIVENNLRRDDLRAEDKRWIELSLKRMEDGFNMSVAEVTKAREIQAKEYERRLEVLNHAHAEAQRILGTYIPRELYERAHAEVVEWQRKADIRLVEIDARIKKVELGLVDLPGGVKSLELGLASQNASMSGSRMTLSNAITISSVVIAVIVGVIALLSYLGK